MSDSFAHSHYCRRLSGALHLLAVSAAACALVACGGDDDGDVASQAAAAPAPAPGSPGGSNRPPTISGSPATTTVMQGSPFEFVPTAADPDGDVLTFSVAQLPPWATFDTATGRIAGTPGPQDIGTYSGITISVSDGSSTATLQAFELSVVATASGSATLSWQAPTQRSDGTALTNLAGYKIYWGTTRGTYPHSVTIDNPGVTTYVIDQLTPATWYFVATAFDSAGVESEFSNVASKTVR